MSIPITVPVLPPAFDPSNPNYQKNITAANTAAKALNMIHLQKVDFLESLVEGHFNGIDGLCSALADSLAKQHVPIEHADDDVEMVRDEYNRLQNEHKVTTEQLLSAVSGR